MSRLISYFTACSYIKYIRMARQTGRGPILGIISNTQVQVILSKQQNPFKSSEFIIRALGLVFRLPSLVESAKFKVLRPIFFRIIRSLNYMEEDMKIYNP